MKKRLLVIILTTIIFFSCWHIKKIHYNWDVVFYAGSIFNNPSEPEKSRELMIKAFENSNFIDYKNEIIPKTKYGINVFSNGKSYEEQYAFYNIRIIYNKTIKLIYYMGTDPIYAVYIASFIYAVLCILTIFYFGVQITNNLTISFLICLYIILKPGFVEFITSSPDTLSAFSLLLFISSYFSKKKWAIYLSTFFCILSRTDNIIFIILLNGIILLTNFLKKTKPSFEFISIIIATLSYVTINICFNNPGFRVLYYHTFIEHLSYPLRKPKYATINQIIAIFKPNLLYLIHPLLYLLATFVYSKFNLKKLFTSPALLVIFVSCITFAIRFILFPSVQPRFEFQYFLIATLCILYLFRDSLHAFFNPGKKSI
jgi:hypothetical protein